MSKYNQEDKENIAFLMVMYKSGFITYDEMTEYIDKIISTIHAKEAVC